MDTTFYILLSMQTPGGPESFAQFFVGNDRDGAYTLFRSLKRTPDTDEHKMLYFDLVETRSGLPMNLEVIASTIDQLAENCKIITKAIFRIKNLESKY